MSRVRAAGVIVLVCAVLAAILLAKGWPPLLPPAISSSGNNVRISELQVTGLGVVFLVAVLGVAMLLSGPSVAEMTPDEPPRDRREDDGSGFPPA